MVATDMSKTDAAAAYYNDEVISKFYRRVWGGSDIHIGLYRTGTETVADASAAMTRYLIDRAGLRGNECVLDMACGFGGTIGILAKMGCKVTGIDISQTCVDAARRANAEAGLGDQITVSLGDFHEIRNDAATWDAVICQESLIHSPDRPRVFSEVYRVLRPGGVFAFSDILTSLSADIEKVEAAFARLRADVGATIRDYETMASQAGFVIEFVEERPQYIVTHYNKLAEALDQSNDSDFADIKSSIDRWQDALSGGHITWACFVARKPN
jgi:sarcosine/dimethylglycine N-methyltransferase